MLVNRPNEMRPAEESAHPIISGVPLRVVLSEFCKKVSDMSTSKIVFIALLVTLQMSGNASQIIAMNFWLKEFDENGGDFVAFAISNFIFFSFFAVSLLVYICIHRPNLDFAFTKKSIVLLVIIGLFDALNSEFSIHATDETPEVLQAIFQSMQSVWTVVLVKVLTEDDRQYANKWVFFSLFFIVSGVLIASFDDIQDNSAITTDQKWWSLIFFCSVPLMSVYNVLQEKYMHDLTESDEKPSDAKSPKGDDTTVKFFMLFGDTFFQLIFCAMCLPGEAIPWFGNASSVKEAWNLFAVGVEDVFTWGNNLAYCTLYCSGFVAMYVGSAYLNDYSAALCSMIGQLTSPTSALVLIIIPSWNANKDNTPWYYSFGGVVFLITGTVIWAIWEELSRHEEEQRQVEKLPLLKEVE